MEDRIFWAQKANSTRYNDGEYKLKLLNDKIVAVGDNVLVRFTNGTFRGRVKQIAGFGMISELDIISVVFPGKSNGKKVKIDSVLDKV
tara:strand:+ start:239 stop:502 length:264 start_codon:yes stop_codon:yes gene_type:complete